MTRGNLLWIGGWSMSSGIFDKLRLHLHDYGHLTVQYEQVETSGDFIRHARVLADLLRNKRPETKPASVTAADELGYGLPEYIAVPAASVPASERKPLIAVGWSLGGLVAQRLAAEERIDALVLIGSTARFVRDSDAGHPGWPERHVRRMAAALEDREQRAPVLHQFTRLMFTDDERSAGLDKGWPDASGWSQAALVAGIHYLLEEDTRLLLAGLSCPVTIVHGSDDMICPWGAAEHLHQVIPASACIRIDQAGHVPFLGRERDIAAIIRRMSDAIANSDNPAAL